MTSRTLRSGLLIALLITLATTATAVVDGPEPGDDEMAITGHTGSTSVSGSAGASRSTGFDEHVSDITLDFTFDGETSIPEACQEDLSEAREAAQDQICTQQVANLRCPHDNETVVMAPNGCVIGGLEAAGWTRTTAEAGSGSVNASAITLTGEIAFRTGGYAVQTDSRTEDGTAVFTINVTAPGPNETVTQAITTEQINLTEESGTYDSAEATVYIDGEEVYSRTESRQSEQVVEEPSRPPVEPPARGLEQRVDQLEQRVATLEARLRMMENALQQEGIIEEDGMTLPENGPGNSTGSGDEREETSQEPSPPGRGIIDAIQGLFGR